MSSSLTPGRLAERLQEKLDLDKESIANFGSELFTIIIRELKKDDNFSLFGFGSFKKIYVKERMGRNPQTGEELIVPSHYRIKFSPAGKLADRINAGYAHLKPIILEDDIHEGLLLKAERYILSTPAEAEPVIEVTTESIIPPTTLIVKPEPILEPESINPELLFQNLEVETQIPEDLHKEPDFGFKKDNRFRTLKTIFIGLVLLICFLGAGWLLLRKTEETMIVEEIALPEAVTPEAVILPEPAAAIERTEGVEIKEPEPPVLPGTSYRIVPGDSFSLLAQKRWGNITLWPYLYSKNISVFSDPDLVRPGDSIIIPTQPVLDKDQSQIEDSILMAYKRYRDLISEQIGNPRNPRREISADYVLLGGEQLYPRFLDRNKSSIRVEDIRRVEKLIP
ncbi:HU family DNA-binding protein [Oceanispirochaeta sp.]|jgi:nucleoid DNA-binding protein|uniref:HU family DNA-binding protein n=1 Tax=Oceanispirochaeta sp. TaxID=2035350 RepID=UPI002624155E|nr:HU family DNA-binding protein [Oceanispirochaeta sp.]MDA3958925.1 HU family DNA-binding protein [Oceanispirochaeta sp.]